MTTPRSGVVQYKKSAYYNCTSTCVRKLSLLGDGKTRDYRRVWIKMMLRSLAEVFAIDVVAHAIMSNHVHILLRTHPERVKQWSNHEVISRWSKVYPQSVMKWARAMLAADKALRDSMNITDISAIDLETAIQVVALDEDRVAEQRRELVSVSRFHQIFKQDVARRANQEDGVTGNFWRSRFNCKVVIGTKAVLAVMAYIELNAVHAGIAATPEESDHTSIKDRILVRQFSEKSMFLEQSQQELEDGNPHRSKASARSRKKADERLQEFLCSNAKLIAPLMRPEVRRTLESSTSPRLTTEEAHGSMVLVPIDSRIWAGGVLPMTLDEWLTLIDAIGRVARPDKKGSIDRMLAPILERLSIDLETLQSALGSIRSGVVGTVIGDAAAFAEEAARRGVSRVRGLRISPT